MYNEVTYQAHRGTVEEGPENTLAALRYGWQFPGAIPETDVRTTADDALICIHDATLARTTNAPDPIAQTPVHDLTLAEVRRWDAGIRYHATFAGERVPTLDEVLSELQRDVRRRLYLEPKDVDLRRIREHLSQKRIDLERILFVSGHEEQLAEIQEVFPGAAAMTWIGGPVATIEHRLRHAVESGVPNVTQLQVHLYPASNEEEGQFALGDGRLAWALEGLAKRGIALQIRQMALSAGGLAHLLRLGVRLFVTDAPGRFDGYLRKAMLSMDNSG